MRLPWIVCCLAMATACQSGSRPGPREAPAPVATLASSCPHKLPKRVLGEVDQRLTAREMVALLARIDEDCDTSSLQEAEDWILRQALRNQEWAVRALAEAGYMGQGKTAESFGEDVLVPLLSAASVSMLDSDVQFELGFRACDRIDSLEFAGRPLLRAARMARLRGIRPLAAGLEQCLRVGRKGPVRPCDVYQDPLVTCRREPDSKTCFVQFPDNYGALGGPPSEIALRLLAIAGGEGDLMPSPDCELETNLDALDQIFLLAAVRGVDWAIETILFGTGLKLSKQTHENDFYPFYVVPLLLQLQNPAPLIENDRGVEMAKALRRFTPPELASLRILAAHLRDKGCVRVVRALELDPKGSGYLPPSGVSSAN